MPEAVTGASSSGLPSGPGLEWPSMHRQYTESTRSSSSAQKVPRGDDSLTIRRHDSIIRRPAAAYTISRHANMHAEVAVVASDELKYTRPCFRDHCLLERLCSCLSQESHTMPVKADHNTANSAFIPSARRGDPCGVCRTIFRPGRQVRKQWRTMWHSASTTAQHVQHLRTVSMFQKFDGCGRSCQSDLSNNKKNVVMFRTIT